MTLMEAPLPGPRIDIKALHEALDAKRQERGLSWRSAGKEAGVAPAIFWRLAKGLRPDVDTFAALVTWLGEPADHFITIEDADS